HYASIATCHPLHLANRPRHHIHLPRRMRKAHRTDETTRAPLFDRELIQFPTAAQADIFIRRIKRTLQTTLASLETIFRCKPREVTVLHTILRCVHMLIAAPLRPWFGTTIVTLKSC